MANENYTVQLNFFTKDNAKAIDSANVEYGKALKAVSNINALPIKNYNNVVKTGINPAIVASAALIPLIEKHKKIVETIKEVQVAVPSTDIERVEVEVMSPEIEGQALMVDALVAEKAELEIEIGRLQIELNNTQQLNINNGQFLKRTLDENIILQTQINEMRKRIKPLEGALDATTKTLEDEKNRSSLKDRTIEKLKAWFRSARNQYRFWKGEFRKLSLNYERFHAAATKLIYNQERTIQALRMDLARVQEQLVVVSRSYSGLKKQLVGFSIVAGRKDLPQQLMQFEKSMEMTTRANQFAGMGRMSIQDAKKTTNVIATGISKSINEEIAKAIQAKTNKVPTGIAELTKTKVGLADIKGLMEQYPGMTVKQASMVKKGELDPANLSVVKENIQPSILTPPVQSFKYNLTDIDLSDFMRREQGTR